VVNRVTQRYEDFLEGIRRLSRLVPPRDPGSGMYADDEAANVQAVCIRLLAHAEIEHFIEDGVSLVLDSAEQGWSSVPSIVSSSLVSLVVFPVAERREWLMPNTVGKYGTSTHPDTRGRVQIAIRDYKNAIRQNHGIKERNVLELLVPIGVDPRRLDQTLLNELNSYGEERGALAHRSISMSFRARQLRDPNDEWAKATRLAEELRSLSEMLEGMML
jgi:hypothetical protein